VIQSFQLFCGKFPILRKRLLTHDDRITDKGRGLGTYEFQAHPFRGKLVNLDSVHGSTMRVVCSGAGGITDIPWLLLPRRR
jgi:hypothetical protein